MSAAELLTAVEKINSRQLRERLDKLDAERTALLALMRAVRARERKALPRKKGVRRG